MRKVKVVFFVLSFLLIMNNSSAVAMQQAEIEPNKLDLSYNMQFWDDEIRGLNFELDMGLTQTIGIQSIFTYADDDELYWDNNIKFKAVDNNEVEVSGLVGHHTDFDEAYYPRFGLVMTSVLNQYLNLNAGADFLIDHDEALGFFVGFDYMISNNLDFELGYRRLSGQDQQGFIIGLRHSL